ncbi:hypothetical protein [Micromonospora sp. WMMD736]|uniref:hypothetical protein n=1 Tax=Micromonospora sp. WMMD736 TaxID=3404112 RepID=UPI003B94307D
MSAARHALEGSGLRTLVVSAVPLAMELVHCAWALAAIADAVDGVFVVREDLSAIGPQPNCEDSSGEINHVRGQAMKDCVLWGPASSVS